MFNLSWGINPQLIINKKLAKLELLKPEDVGEIEKLLFKKIIKNVEYIKNHNSKYGKESLELLKDDKFMLNFNINLENIHKSIKEKSLETYENIPEEEVYARFKAELDWMKNIDDSVFD